MRLTAVVASLAVLAGLGVSGPPPASAASSPSQSTVDPTQAADKLEPELKQAFRTDQTADYWLEFQDKANLKPAKTIKDWNERGQYVYDALKKAADASLATVAPELDAAGVDYKSYPIANAVLISGGTKGLALDLAANTDVAEVHETPDVELVEPVGETKPEDTRPAKTSAKAVAADADTVEWGLNYIHAPEAWAMGATGAGITVSSIDSGVQFDHPALVNQYRGNNGDGTFDHNYNWYNTRNSCDDAPCDDNGHGTHTMGTMVGDDGAGNHIGVAPDAQWIETNGCCQDTGVDSLLDSGWWLLAPTDLQGKNPDVSMRPHIINNSWGQDAEHAYSDFFTAIDQAWTAAGIFGVWAAGNTSPGAGCDSVSSPASAPDAYSVGAFDSTGQLGAFSRKGEGEDGVIKPEISAPGVDVRSSWPTNSYNSISGTSMAAPHIAGAVADLWSYDPTLIGQIDETRRLLAESADDVDDTQCGGTAAFNNMYGEGRLNLVKLLELAPREGGTLSGVVTDNGQPVSGAELKITGPFTRTIGTDKDGSYSLNLPVGDYQISASAFGYLPGTASAKIAMGEHAVADIALTAAAKHDVSGTIVDKDGEPVPNADITVRNTPLDGVTTGEDGTFTIADVPEGQYVLDVKANACFSPTTTALTVGSATEPITITVAPVVDKGGYSCAVSEGDYLSGTDKVDFPSGVWATVKLPFPIALYNGSHDTLGISLRGVISPDATTGPGTGGAGVFPFYTQTPVQFADGGGVYTAATKVDGEDAFVIEFRNAKIWSYPIKSEYSAPVNFSATLTRSGKVIFSYGDGIGTDDPVTGGVRSISGIQGWAGVDGIRFSEYTASFHDGMVVTYDLPAWGYVDSTIVDNNDGLPLSGATVSFSNAEGLVESVTTNATGVVHRQLPVDDYTMTVSAPNYVTGSYDFSIDKLYAGAKIDARLKTGVADLVADGLDTVLGTDQNGKGSLTLTNTGSAPVTFDLGEAARHPELDPADTTTPTATGTDSDLDLHAWKQAAAEPEKVGPTAGGDVISRIEIPGDTSEKEPSGLGYDGDVWVHDYDKKINTAYTVLGKKVKEFPADWNPQYRAFDMAFDSRTGDMCQMEDSPASYIHCFDRDTGKETRQIKGDWSTLQLTGLAYNPELDVFYVGGRRNGMIGTVAGTTHDNPGALLSFCAPPLPEIMGLAYNQASDTIWYTDLTTNRPTRLLQVDPVDCSLVNAWWFPGQKAGQGGGLATDSTGALWATDQLADDVLLVDVEDDLTTDLSWLSLSKTSGTLAPGESTKVDVSISADDVDPGVLGANIVVKSDSGRQSKEYVPVTLTTTDYQVGVDAGGSAFTDGSGFDWAADQSKGDGAWGYQGKTKVISTKTPIDGTSDDALFQSQRTTPSNDLTYVFDDAPKGTYNVDLGFAEIENVAPGKRVFDVLVDGALTDYAYDAAGTVGRQTADWRRAVVKHDGGPLTIHLKGANGLRPPALAALRVTLDPRPIKAEGPDPEQPKPAAVPVAPANRTYTMKETTGLYRQGTTNAEWTGDEGCGVLWFGFDFPFYDTTWDGVCIGWNGNLTFDRRSSLSNNSTLPSRYPADAIYPFWDDLIVDNQASIYFGRTTVDGLLAEVIDYRNVALYSDRSARVTFSVTLVEDGRIQIGYADGVGGDNPLTKGSSATVGIESLTGTRAMQYSYNQPVLSAGLGLEYTRPASGTIEGKVTDANDGKPIAGAVVTLTAEDGSTRTITANNDGLWKAQALLGKNTVSAWSPNYVASDNSVSIAETGQAEVVDTALKTGIAKVSGDDLDWFLGPNQKSTGEVTVTNTGSAPMSVDLSEQARDGGSDDLPWLSLSGAAADGTVSLAVGESTTVTASVDNAGVAPGVVAGDVVVSSTAGRAPEQRQPARMATSAYWRGVNVGGQALVGGDGFDWSADQALAAGSWGYVDGATRSTDADIAGTDDDGLYRTHRSGKTFSYVFKNAPAGTYQIDLGFAELDNVQAGKRTFDVLVDGKAVLYDHDVQAEVGRLTADAHTVTVKHTGGDLTVKLVGETGKRDPMLSSLKVLEDPRS